MPFKKHMALLFLGKLFMFFLLVTIVVIVNRVSDADGLAKLCLNEVISRKMSYLLLFFVGRTGVGRSV